jgi:signal transduction histidine kinase
MTIKGKVHLVIYVILIFTIITGILLYWTSENINIATARLTEDQKILNSAFKLKIFLEEYMDYFEERPLVQWESEYKHLGTLLSRRRDSTDPQVFADLQKTFEKIGMLHDGLIASQESNTGPRHDELFSILNYNLEQIVDQISQLHAEAATGMLNLQRFGTTIAGASMVGFLSIVIFLLVVIRRSVTNPIQDILNAIASLKNGVWDYQFRRITKDELGSVKQSFSDMATRLDSSIKALELEIKERKETQQHLERSNQDLEHFAYVASHDLQEPLRTISSALQLFERKHKGEFGADSDQLIQFAVEGAKKMKALVQDLLTYSRLNTQGQPFREINAQEIIEESIINLRSLIEEKGTKITYDEMPVLKGDSRQLVQLFQNLIQNALKFGPAQSAKVHISARKNHNEWVFSVKDNGIGIQSEYFDKIFEIFEQLEASETFHGTGIGLAIAKKIVERHGGRIGVESEVGVGSTFYFTIPKEQ